LVVLAAGLLVATFGVTAPSYAASSKPVTHLGVRHVQAFNSGRFGKSEGPATSSRRAAAGSSLPTLYVSTSGSDTGTCRLSAHACQTIGYALSQAPANAQIDLAAGTYPEQVVIPTGDNITIVGAGEHATTIQPTSVGASDPDPDDAGVPVYAVVDVPPGAGATLKKLTVDGAAAQSSFDGCSEDFTGVYYHDATGGLTNVAVTNIELPEADFGCQDGLGVYAAADAGSVTSVAMSDVVVNSYDKNGITCDDAGTTCSVASSTVTGIGPTGLIAQNGIQGYGAGSVTLTGDTVSGNSYSESTTVATGLLLCDNGSTKATSIDATGNDVDVYLCDDSSAPTSPSLSVKGVTASSASTASGVDGYGIIADSVPGGTIENSTANGDTQGGIDLFGASDLTVSGNTANKDSDGIYVGGPGASDLVGSTANTVSSNVTNASSGDGILADSDSSGNVFSSNSAKANVTYDYQDSSTGTGTAGTANTWSGDTCHPSLDSLPEHLC
jgi:parallel beta-helix repeat protein